MLRRASALLMVLSSAVPLVAQSLDQVATRERRRRETAVASPSRVFTDEDLRRYVGQRPEAPSQLPSDQTPAASGPLLSGEAPRQDAYGRHWASAEAYFRRCEERLRAANDGWLTASEASPAGAATQARRAVEKAAGALGRAREYRDRAEVAARVAGALPAGLR